MAKVTVSTKVLIEWLPPACALAHGGLVEAAESDRGQLRFSAVRGMNRFSRTIPHRSEAYPHSSEAYPITHAAWFEAEELMCAVHAVVSGGLDVVTIELNRDVLTFGIEQRRNGKEVTLARVVADDFDDEEAPPQVLSQEAREAIFGKQGTADNAARKNPFKRADAAVADTAPANGEDGDRFPW